MSELTKAYLDESLQKLDSKFEQRLDESIQKLDSKFEQRLDESIQKLDSKFEQRLDESIQKLDSKFEQRLDASIQKLDSKFQQRLDQSLKMLDEKFEQRLERQNQNIVELLNNFGRMFVEVLDKRTIDLDKRMETGFAQIRNDIADLKKHLNKLQTDMDNAKIRIYDVENELRVIRQA